MKVCERCGARYEETNIYHPRYLTCPGCGGALAEEPRASSGAKALVVLCAVLVCCAGLGLGGAYLYRALYPVAGQGREAGGQGVGSYVRAVKAAKSPDDVVGLLDEFLARGFAQPREYLDFAHALRERGWNLYALRILNHGWYTTGSREPYDKIREYWPTPYQVQPVMGGFTLLGRLFGKPAQAVSWEEVESIRYLSFGSQYYQSTDTGTLLEYYAEVSTLDPATAGDEVFDASIQYITLTDQDVENCRGFLLQDGTAERGFPLPIFLNLTDFTSGEGLVISTDLVGALPRLHTLDLAIYMNPAATRSAATPEEADPFAPLAGLQNLEAITLRTAQNPASVQLPQVREVTFESSNLPLEMVGSFPNLKYLTLNACEITDLSPLGGLDGLERLNVTDCPVYDLGPVPSLQNIDTLWLAGTNIQDFYALPELPNLRDLLVFDAAAGARFPPVGELSGLTALWVDIPLDDGLMKLTSLEDLWVTGLNDLTPLSGMHRLKALTLDNCQSFTGIENLEALAELTLLGPCPDPGPLAGCPVRSLELFGTDAGSAAPVVSALHLEGLRVLGLQPPADPKRYQPLLEAIAAQEGLRRLTISSREYGEELRLGPYCAPLAALTGLRELNLEYVGLTDIEFVRDMKELETASFFGNYISDFSPLDTLPALRSANIGAN